MVINVEFNKWRDSITRYMTLKGIEANMDQVGPTLSGSCSLFDIEKYALLGAGSTLNNKRRYL